jgi:hypothetical protein
MCERSRLKSITKCIDNAGGNAAGMVITLDIASKSVITSIPEPGAGSSIITDNIVMVEDTRTAAEVSASSPADPIPGVFSEFEFSEIGLAYSGAEEGEAEDGNLVHTVTGIITKMNPLKSYILEGTRGGLEHIVRFIDRNGNKWLIGDNNEGAKITVVPQTNDRNGYTLTITWRSSRLLYAYTGAIALQA